MIPDAQLDRIRQWIIQQEDEILALAERWGYSPGDFTILMLADAIQSYKNVEPSKL